MFFVKSNKENYYIIWPCLFCITWYKLRTIINLCVPLCNICVTFDVTSVFVTVSTLDQSGTIPLSYNMKPANVNSCIPNIHFFKIKFNPYFHKVSNNMSSRTFISFTDDDQIRLSSEMDFIPGHATIHSSIIFWYCSKASFLT